MREERRLPSNIHVNRPEPYLSEIVQEEWTKESEDFVKKILRQGYQYVTPVTFSRNQKHEDIELTEGHTLATNPDGIWRSAQINWRHSSTCEKLYIRF